MSGIKDQDRIEALRKRLYQRGHAAEPSRKHVLSDVKEKVKTRWDKPKKTPVQTAPVSDIAPEQPDTSENYQSSTQEAMVPVKRKRKYRLKLLLAGVLFFVISVAASSAILIFGNKSISGENITLAVTGPFTIGGGEVLPLQVGITNDNSVSIKSATLIVEYPLGTQSAAKEQSNIFIERLPLEAIISGETINIPIRAIVFGEENQEKEVQVSIEYRIDGSNATFFKEAEALRFKISSSPIIVSADALKKVSSGQEVDIALTITSNSQSALSEVLVKAEYPLGFDYTTSDPKPVSAQNIWIIKDLKPEETKTIIIKGIVVGKETDEYAINFTVGVPNEKDQQTLASVFATAQTQFEIEQPFLNVSLEIAGVTNSEAVITPGQRSGGAIVIQNTLEDTIYDIEVVVQLGGNALSDLKVGPPNGFYDSLSNQIIWDVSNAPDLQELYPGKKIRLSFGVEPSDTVLQTPQITLDVNVKARRVSESNVTEVLIGTAQSVLKVASEPNLRADIGFNNGTFSDSGPVPPEAEKKTTYTSSFMIESGTNDLSNAVVTATLPSYVTWLDRTSGSGAVVYDPVRRLITWQAGSVDANTASFASFQVQLIPSKTQIGITPVLIGEQRMKANDLFTGTVVRSANPAITSEMSLETGQSRDNGRVVE